MSNSLSQLMQPCSTDFELRLADSTVLTCQYVVRVVPKKRVVCQALWQGKSVYAKLFFGKNASKYAARDATGVKWLAEANIDTPSLLYQGEAAEESTRVLIFEAITSANNAEELWQALNQNQRLALAKKIVAEVAKHHNGSLLQTDLYLKNFLVANDKIYTLDGDGVRKCSDLSRKQALHNLAVIWSKFDVLDIEQWQQTLAETYAKVSTRNDALQPDKLVSLANQYRLQAASHYADKKVFRQCTDVNVTFNRSALSGLLMAASSHANINIPTNMADLDALIQSQHLLKNGNTCTVALAEIDDKKIVIKRYNIKNFWHGISRAFRPSRAAASWANAHRLNILNVATAKPIAFYEQRTFGLRGKAFFLAEYLDLPDVAQYFAQTHNKTHRAEAVKNIVMLFYKLYLLHISHGDMKATNIKMQGTQPVLIDLDSMRQHRSANIADHVRDLQRFMQNWHASNQPRDNALYNAFVKTFKVIYPDDLPLIKAGIATNKEIT